MKYYYSIILQCSLLIFISFNLSAQNLTIMVNPFQNNSSPEYDWISRGMSATAISDLSKTSSIEVISKMDRDHAMEELKLSLSGLIEENKAIEIGKWKGAQFILTGSYQVAGPRIRANATMLDVKEGAVVISLKIDGLLDDIFDFQDRIILDLIDRANQINLGGVSWIATSKEYQDVASRAIRPNISAYKEFSLGYSLREKNKSEALTHFKNALRIEPNYADALLEAGSAVISLTRDYKRGQEYYTKAAQLLKNGNEENTVLMAQIFILQGNLAIELNELNKAETYLVKASNILSRFNDQKLTLSSLEYRWGSYYSDKKEYQKALDHYDLSLEYQPVSENRFSPNIIKIYIAQGQTYRKSGLYELSVKKYDEAKNYLVNNSLSNSILYADLIFNYGTTLKDMGFTDKALSYYYEAKTLYENLNFRKDSNYFIFLGNIGGILGSKKEWQAAAESFNTAIALAKETGNIQHVDFPNYIYMEALCHYIMGEKTKAGPLFRESYNVFTQMGLYDNQKRYDALNMAAELGF